MTSMRAFANEAPATYIVYLTLEQQILAQTNSLLTATGCTNGSADAQVECVRAYTTLDLMDAGIANNVVVDGTYITQPAIYWNGTVCDNRHGLVSVLIMLLQGSINSVPVMIGTMRDDR